MRNALRNLLLSLGLGLMFACTSGGDGGGGGGGGADQARLQAEIERLFPYTERNPNIIYRCGRSNSVLVYFFHLRPDATFSVYLTDDTGQDHTFDGIYQLQNGVLRLTSQNVILPLDETSTQIRIELGMLWGFATPIMACGAYAHGYNAVNDYGHFRCPDINRGPASTESNALEVNHFSLPFNIQAQGAMFRQRDTYVTGALNPIVRRGDGVYRRTGDNWYAYFYTYFDDHTYLSGTFDAGDQAVTPAEFGVACRR